MELTLSQRQQDAKALLNSIIFKCWEDETFKKNLIDSPRATIEAFIGKPMKMPEGKSFTVVDQTTPNTIYLNIPSKPNLEDLELTDEQLEMVAGGLFPLVLFVVLASPALLLL